MMTDSDDVADFSLRPLWTALLLTVVLWVAIALTARMHPDGPDSWERTWIEALRDSKDPARMIGPPIVEETFRDLSALGGYAVVSLLTVGFSIYLNVRARRTAVRFFLITVLGGYGCGMLLKLAFGRLRPAVVPHLSFVATTSFPSVHSMVSAVLYLTMGLMLSRQTLHPPLRRLFVWFPFLLTGLVGISRVAMGVHYPTDVLAGWSAGLLWTLTAFHLCAPTAAPSACRDSGTA